MLRLKIQLTAKKECKNYSSKNVVWDELPFIQKQITECSILYGKIMFREKKANRIFQRIRSLQSDYAKILTDCEINIREITDKMKRQKEKIETVDHALEIRNKQIQMFNATGRLEGGEPIFQVREDFERLAQEKGFLEGENDALYRQIEEIKSDTRKKLDQQYEMLKIEYKNFSESLNTITNKVGRKVTDKKNQAVLYANFFWNYYIKQYMKNQRRNNGRKIKPELPNMPRLNMDKFKRGDIFAEEREQINAFNQKHQIDYTV